MENKKIKIKDKEFSNEEFNKLKEDIEKDKNKKLKKISENEYAVLQKMEG